MDSSSGISVGQDGQFNFLDGTIGGPDQFITEQIDSWISREKTICRMDTRGNSHPAHAVDYTTSPDQPTDSAKIVFWK